MDSNFRQSMVDAAANQPKLGKLIIVSGMSWSWKKYGSRYIRKTI